MSAKIKAYLIRAAGMSCAAIIACIGPFIADPHLAWWAFFSVGGVIGVIYPQPKNRRL